MFQGGDRVKTDPYLAARLLSKKKDLSVLEKEQIFAQVVHHAAVRGKPSQGRGVFVLRLASGLAALAVIVAVPVFVNVNRPSPQDEFLARGGQSANATYSVKCLGAKGETKCVQGNKLIFEVTPPEEQRYFAAFAKADDGTIIWYFPGDENTKSLKVEENKQRGILAKGIRLGAEHRPGRYELYGIFSSAPLARAQIRNYFDNKKEPKDVHLTVLKKNLSVGQL